MERLPVRFFISGNDQELFPGQGLWNEPLSGKSSQFTHTAESFENSMSDASVIRIGDYLKGCASFISEKHYTVLTSGVSSCLKKPVALDDLLNIDLCLDKHGAFYHPVKLTVALKNKARCRFVLNGAVSERGLGLVENEALLLKQLGQQNPFNLLPAVYGSGFIETAKGLMGFFMGQWLEGYKEFHVTRQQGNDQVVIWDSDGTCTYYPMENAFPIYGRAARILTTLYALETAEQVFPWHHAAGDFIVKAENGKFDVRLITVRGYENLTDFEPEPGNPAAHILPSLMFFFIQLTLRMRVDRLDGVGDYVLVDEAVLPEICNGFFEALEIKADTRNGLGDLKKSVVHFLNQFGLEDWVKIAENLIESFPSHADETRLLTENLTAHCTILKTILKSV